MIFYLNYTKSNGNINIEVENIAKSRFETRKVFNSPQASNNFTPIKLNGLKAKQYPKSVYSFKTELEGWKELRTLIKGHQITAALSKGNTLAFASIEEIKKVFNGKMKSEIMTVDIDDNLTYKQDSFFTGLLYDLIDLNLRSERKLNRVGTNRIKKYYSTNAPVLVERTCKI